MARQTSLSKTIQWWGIAFLFAVGGSIIILDIIVSLRDFHSRAEQLRSEYIDQQKQIVKREVTRVVFTINHEKSKIEKATKDKIRSRVNRAYSIAENIYQQNKVNKNKVEIQQMIIDALRPKKPRSRPVLLLSCQSVTPVAAWIKPYLNASLGRNVKMFLWSKINQKS